VVATSLVSSAYKFGIVNHPDAEHRTQRASCALRDASHAKDGWQHNLLVAFALLCRRQEESKARNKGAIALFLRACAKGLVVRL
jgi:hypothetical protein